MSDDEFTVLVAPTVPQTTMHVICARVEDIT